MAASLFMVRSSELRVRPSLGRLNRHLVRISHVWSFARNGSSGMNSTIEHRQPDDPQRPLQHVRDRGRERDLHAALNALDQLLA